MRIYAQSILYASRDYHALAQNRSAYICTFVWENTSTRLTGTHTRNHATAYSCSLFRVFCFAYACVCVYTHTHINTRTQARAHTHIHTSAHTHIHEHYVYRLIYTYHTGTRYTRIYTYKYVHKCIHLLCMCTSAHTRTYSFMYDSVHPIYAYAHDLYMYIQSCNYKKTVSDHILNGRLLYVCGTYWLLFWSVMGAIDTAN
jgi:hypothetical protein